MRRASDAAARPGAMPQRSMPTSISTSPPSTTPKSRATRAAPSPAPKTPPPAPRAAARPGAIKHHPAGPLFCERGQPPQLAFADHLIAHQHVLHTAANEHFRFADLLHALADRAERDLP